jgi:hypothetical protein
MPVDTIASHKEREARRRRSGSDTMQAVIVQTVCGLRGTESNALACRIEALPKATPPGLCTKGLVTAGFGLSPEICLYGRCCVVSASATNRRRPAKSIPMHGRTWEPGVTEDAGVSLRRMSPLLALAIIRAHAVDTSGVEGTSGDVADIKKPALLTRSGLSGPTNDASRMVYRPRDCYFWCALL